MATSGTITTSVKYGNVKLVMTRTSVDTPNNISYWTATLSTYCSGTINASAAKSYTITVNGSSWSGTFTFGSGFKGTKTIRTVTGISIPHNSDGTKTFNYSFSFSPQITYNGTWIGTVTGSGSITCDPIARATSPSVSASSVAMGSSVTISTPRASGSFTHTLTYSFAGATGAIASEVGTSYTWAVPLSLASNVPNATSGTCTITCTTYNGSTWIGAKTVSLTLTVPSSVVPAISSVSVTEATEGLAAKFGAFVQNKSALAVSISASGSYGSTITKYETYVQSAPYYTASFTTGVITVSGAIDIATTVTDSRGRTATSSKSVTIIEYSPPTIELLKCWRIDPAGAEDDDGERLAMQMKFSISSVGGKNDHTYALKYKVSADTEFTTFASGTASLVYDDTQLRTSAPVLSADNSYTIRLEIADYFETRVADFNLSSSFTLINYGSSGKGIAFGKASEKDGMEIAMDVQLYNELETKSGGTFDTEFPLQVLDSDSVDDPPEESGRIFKIGTPPADTYYLMIGSSGTAHAGTQLNEAETISWDVQTGASRANSFIYEHDLGTSFTDEQSADIRAGKFEKVRTGGYWTINGRKYWATHADYRLHCGDTELTTHHMLVIPDKSFYNGVMNDTNVTTGSYYGSKMKTSGLANALATVKEDFGTDHILSHRALLANAVSNGASSGWAWYDSQIDLMNEHMVYGSYAWGGGAQNGYDVGADKSQLALFQARPDLITNRENWWLRDVRSATFFCNVYSTGLAYYRAASDSIGVRPAFLIY